tara:strand:- start:274 stop:1095 length:822 start_codon:yes stop_codon:yes gene_type:complete
MSKEDILKDIERLISEVPIIYQYMPFEGAKTLLEDMTIMAKSPTEFNDPYDCDLELLDFSSASKDRYRKSIENFNSNLSSDKKHRKIDFESLTDDKVIEMYKNYAFPNFAKTIGVSCFSEKGDNSLMWSHYTRSHKGICIGFDLTKLYFSLRGLKKDELALIQVKYTDSFESIDYFEDYNASIYHWISTKSNIWSYEEEVRILFTNLKFNHHQKFLFEFDKKAISEIFLGSKITVENEEWIRDFSKENLKQTKLYKMTKPKNSFKLKAKELEI